MLSKKGLHLLFFLCTFFLAACNSKVEVTAIYDGNDSTPVENAKVYLDGKSVGVTDTAGKLTVAVQSNKAQILRVESDSVGAEISVNVPSNTTQSAVLTLTGEGLAQNIALTVPQVASGILPISFGSFELAFSTQAGLKPKLTYFNYIDLYAGDNEDGAVNVTGLFELDAQGSVKCNNITQLKSLLQSTGYQKKTISIYAEDEGGRVYSSSTSFYLGVGQILGSLIAPPSYPSLATNSVDITLTYLVDETISLKASSDGNGGFSFAGIPSGNWKIEATTTVGDTQYFTIAVVNVVSSLELQLNLLANEDLLNGVPYFQVVSASLSNLTVSTSDAQARSVAASKTTTKASALIPTGDVAPAATGDTTVSVTASSGAQNVANTATDFITIPAGTISLNLRYEVISQEYPDYVLQQSVFNDIWSITVRGENGQQLFEITKQVNSQLYAAPIWQSNGSTGVINETINVAAIAQADTDVYVTVSSTNIGDSVLTTTVNAVIGVGPQLSIQSIAPLVTHPYISIPRPGLTNTEVRKFNVIIEKPDDVVVSKVKAELVRSGSSSLIAEAQPIDTRVEQINDKQYRVTVTHDANQVSDIASQPPAFHNFRYRFTVEGMKNGVPLPESAVRESSGINALWRMPDGMTRFGGRDAGGDDWSAKGTYEWLVQNANLVPAINDVSGEHGRNIGHQSHRRGTDIDTYLFVDLTGNHGPAGTNYNRIRDRTIAAVGGNIAAQNDVINFIEQSRNGLDDLAALNSVAQLIYTRGAQSGVLPAGWAHLLITTGQFQYGLNNANTFDTGLGNWAQGKVRYQNDHNDHLHIDLNDTVLNNTP